MKTTIDITEDASPSEPSTLPSPSVVMDGGGDEVVIELRELEVRMTYEQFVTFTDGLNTWRFRGCGCPAPRFCGQVDLSDEDLYIDHEHEILRRLATALVDNNLDEADVPKDVSDAVRKRLGPWHGPAVERWREVRHRLEDAEVKIRALEEELATLKRKKNKRTP